MTRVLGPLNAIIFDSSFAIQSAWGTLFLIVFDIMKQEACCDMLSDHKNAFDVSCIDIYIVREHNFHNIIYEREQITPRVYSVFVTFLLWFKSDPT